jgi:hypothetical protein
MKMIYAILATTGWAWAAVVAVFLYLRLGRERTQKRPSAAAKKHEE